jgi:hypothetical protein
MGGHGLLRRRARRRRRSAMEVTRCQRICSHDVAVRMGICTLPGRVFLSVCTAILPRRAAEAATCNVGLHGARAGQFKHWRAVSRRLICRRAGSHRPAQRAARVIRRQRCQWHAVWRASRLRGADVAQWKPRTRRHCRCQQPLHRSVSVREAGLPKRPVQRKSIPSLCAVRHHHEPLGRQQHSVERGLKWVYDWL